MQAGQIYQIDNNGLYEIKRANDTMISAYPLDENMNKIKHPKRAGVSELHKVMLFKRDNHEFRQIEVAQ